MPELTLVAALAGGLILLGLGGDVLVNGAAALARRAGVSPLLAGVFIVGFGTSAPEVIVAFNAAIDEHPGLAIGNVVGSNIANIWLVLAVPALIAPLACGGFGLKRSLTVLVIATLLWIWLLGVGPLTREAGYAFLIALAGYSIYTFASAATASRQGVDIGLDDDDLDMPLGRAAFFSVAGLIALPMGAHLIVQGGVGIARTFDVPDEVIGLTILAIGTSLPEIGAAAAAAFRQRGGVMYGNILGSNLFNLLGAGGVVAMFGTVGVDETFRQYDHWALAAATATLTLIVLTRAKVGRLAGAAMLTAYLVYIMV